MSEILSRLDAIQSAVDALLSRATQPKWPMSVAQFAKHVGRSTRTVQGWIDAGLLRANRQVRPALITKANAEKFLEGKE
jgi:hypothetical protein